MILLTVLYILAGVLFSVWIMKAAFDDHMGKEAKISKK